MPSIADTIAAAASRYGVDPTTLMRIATVESRLNPNAANPRSSAKGLFQFIDSTRSRYGNFDPFNADASADAGARLARDNIGVLRNGLGRDPTPAEVYLAHQQGAAGALKLIQNPDAPAASLVGNAAIGLNAGQGGASAGDFVRQWAAKFDGTTPAVSQPGQTAAPVAAAPDSARPMAFLPPIEEPEQLVVPRKQQKAAPKQRTLDLGRLFADLAPA